MSDLKDIWKSQKTEYAPMAIEDIRAQAGKFRSRVQARNLREYIVAVFVIAVFGFYIWDFPNLFMQLGSAMIIAGTLYMVWQLRKRGSSSPLPSIDSASAWLDYHRHALEAQRDALRSIWKWYLAPFVPGLIVFLIGKIELQPHRMWLPTAIAAVICFAVFAGIWALNAWGARRLQREIDKLPRQTD
jgi:Flp pilus assembly protein TadB